MSPFYTNAWLQCRLAQCRFYNVDTPEENYPCNNVCRPKPALHVHRIQHPKTVMLLWNYLSKNLTTPPSQILSLYPTESASFCGNPLICLFLGADASPWNQLSSHFTSVYSFLSLRIKAGWAKQHHNSLISHCNDLQEWERWISLNWWPCGKL